MWENKLIEAPGRFRFFSSSWADIENGAKLQTHIATQVSLSFLKLHWKSVEYANIKFYLGMFHILFLQNVWKTKAYALYWTLSAPGQGRAWSWVKTVISQL